MIDIGWKSETDKFYMRLFKVNTDKNCVKLYIFEVETKKRYYHRHNPSEEGRRFQTFYITEEIIKSETEMRVIDILAKFMQDAIDCLIEMGEIKEREL